MVEEKRYDIWPIANDQVGTFYKCPTCSGAGRIVVRIEREVIHQTGLAACTFSPEGIQHRPIEHMKLLRKIYPSIGIVEIKNIVQTWKNEILPYVTSAWASIARGESNG